MAYCPSCNAAMGQTAVNCDSCGFEFPNALPQERTHLAWSKLADVSLVLGSVLSLFSAVASLVFGAYVLVAAFVNRDFRALLITTVCLIHAVMAFAMYVVFIRVQKDE